MRLEGAPLSTEILTYAKEVVKVATEQRYKTPYLDIVRVSEDPLSVEFTHKLASTVIQMGGHVCTYSLNSNVNGESSFNLAVKLQKRIEEANRSFITGCYIHLPPKNAGVLTNIPTLRAVCEKLRPDLDVGGVRPSAITRCYTDVTEEQYPVFALAAMMLLDYYDINVSNKLVTIVNKSPRFGLPLSILLNTRGAIPVALGYNAPYPVCQEAMKNSDIIISGVGTPGMFSEKDIDFMACPTVLDFGRHKAPLDYGDFDLDMLDHDGIIKKLRYANKNTGIDKVIIAGIVMQLITTYDIKYRKEDENRCSLRLKVPENLKRTLRTWNRNFLF